MRVLKLDGRKAAAWVAVCSALGACASFLNAGVGCESTISALGKMCAAGLLKTTTTKIQRQELLSEFFFRSTNPAQSLLAQCALDCHCENAPIYPVCDQSGHVFYSPCHAGCASPNITAFAALDTDSTPIFDACHCVAALGGGGGGGGSGGSANGNSAAAIAGTQQVSRNFCAQEDCDWKVKLYFFNMALSGVLGGMGVTRKR